MSEASSPFRPDDIWAWFDALVVLAGPGGPSAAALQAAAQVGGRRPAHILLADSADADPAATARAVLLEHKVRRPLIWQDADAPDELSAVWPEAFRVAALDGLPAGAQREARLALIARCDLVVWQDGARAEPIAAPSMVWNRDPFEDAVGRIAANLLATEKRLNVLVLYDEQFSHMKAIQEHLTAFSRHSRFSYFFLPASDPYGLYKPFEDDWPDGWDFSQFDAIIWHFSLRAAYDWHISPIVLARLAQYDGLKVLFTQDDYDFSLTTWANIEAAGIHTVMCIIPVTGAPYAFPDWRPGSVEFIRTLTGFVPEDDMERFATPMAERTLRIAYRGRTLSYRYGSLGREKILIAQETKAFAEARGVPCDIAVDDDSRIYGDDWYRFTASARATLATESGSHIFDFDGALAEAAKAAQASGQTYEEFYAAHLVGLEDHVRANQVSPRVFEAIRLRTALVCFEGEYSGVILPDLHYIPLKKDFSNLDEVFAKLEDNAALEAMTERAYSDVIQSGAWSYRTFVEHFDRIVETRVLRQARAEIISAPVARRRRDATDIEAIQRKSSLEYALTADVLREPFQRRDFADKLEINRVTERGIDHYRVEQFLRPPAEPQTIRDLSLGSLIVCPDGRIAPDERGVRVWLPEGERFAAYLPVDTSGLSFEQEYCWAVLTFEEVRGDVAVAACAYGVDEGMTIEFVPAGQGPTEVVLRMSAGHDALLIHTGVSGVPGEAVLAKVQIVTALAYEPGVLKTIRTIANGSHHLGARILVDLGQDQSVQLYQVPRPAEAPNEAQVVAEAADLGRLRSRGGAIRTGADGVVLDAPPEAWSFCASLALDLSAVRLDHQFCWVRVRLRDVSGDLRISLWDEAQDRLLQERACLASPDQQEILLPTLDPAASCLLFRSGAHDRASRATVLAAEVLVAWRYPKAVVEIAQALAPQMRPSGGADGASAAPASDFGPQAGDQTPTPSPRSLGARLRELFSP